MYSLAPWCVVLVLTFALRAAHLARRFLAVHVFQTLPISSQHGMSSFALRFKDATLNAWSEKCILSEAVTGDWLMIASIRGVDSQLYSMRWSCNSGTRNRSSAITVTVRIEGNSSHPSRVFASRLESTPLCETQYLLNQLLHHNIACSLQSEVAVLPLEAVLQKGVKI